MCFFKKLLLPIVVGFMCMSYSLQAQAVPGCDQSIQLIAGQSINVGIVNLTLDNGDLTVTIDTSGSGWVLGMTHVEAGATINTFPRTKGDLPKVGKFSSKADGNKIDEIVTHVIEDIDVNTDDTIVVAVHAEVFEKDVLSGTITQEETAWAAGTFFNEEKNWSMFFTCTAPPTPPNMCPQLCKEQIDVGICTARALIPEPILRQRCDMLGGDREIAITITQPEPDPYRHVNFEVYDAENGTYGCLVEYRSDSPLIGNLKLPPIADTGTLNITVAEFEDCVRYQVQQINEAFNTDFECEP